MAGRNIFKATSPQKFEGVLKLVSPPPSLSAYSSSLEIVYCNQPASHVTSENSRRFFITCDDFNLKVNQIGDGLEKIKEFALFCRINNQKLIDKNYVYGDVKIFCDFFDL